MSDYLGNEIIKEIQADMGDIGGKFMGLIKNLSQLNVLTTEKEAKKHYDRTLAILKKEKYMRSFSIESRD